MTLLDASALVAGLVGEPARDEVETLLRDRDDPPCVCSVNLAEVVDRLARVRTITLLDVLQRTVWLRDGGLQVLSFDALDGSTAGSFRSLHYDRTDRPISLGDCAALASCLRYGQRLATSDRPLAEVARVLNIGVVPLPNSSGERP